MPILMPVVPEISKMSLIAGAVEILSVSLSPVSFAASSPSSTLTSSASSSVSAVSSSSSAEQLAGGAE